MVGDQDIGSPGRPVSSGLQVPGEPGHCRARTGLPWWTFHGIFLQNVLKLHQQRWVLLCVDSLAIWKLINEEDAVLILKNRGENFPADFYSRNILGLDGALCRHSTDCCFVSGSLWYNQVSSIVTNCDRKSFGLRRKNPKRCSDDWQRWRSWSAFSHFGTHFAESFPVSKSSWMMDPTRSREMSSFSSIDLAAIRRSFQH